jgi:flagellar biosynthetic protein FlhB
MSGDSGEKTEKATPQRMKEVRRKGELSRSQDLSAWIGLAAAAFALPMLIARGGPAAIMQLGRVRDVVVDPTPEMAVQALADGTSSIGTTMLPMFALVVIVTVGVAAGQGGVHPRKLKVHMKQLNVFTGVKNMVGAQSLWQGVKTLLKTLVVAAVLYSGVQALVPTLMGAGSLSIAQLLDTAQGGVVDLMRGGIAAGIALAVLDVVVVMKRNRKRTRMSLQEIKEEHKRTEGDPLLKGAIRSKQMAMSRNRMMAAVADADVVLVNPTHVAVALRYEPGTGAPRVVAKGAGAVAARIRAEAADKRVPMVEDIPLARALHASCEIGQEIPDYLYTAVARILAFVMALRRRGSALGQHRLPTGPTELPPEAADPRAHRRTTAAAARPRRAAPADVTS